MSTEEQNVDLVREVYRHWSDSRADSALHWLKLVSDDVHWQSLSGGALGMQFTRECHSRQDVACYFHGLAHDWELIHYTAAEFIAQRDRVVMLGSCALRHKTTGKTMETPKADFITLKDGKIVEFLEFYDTAKAIAAATSN